MGKKRGLRFFIKPAVLVITVSLLAAGFSTGVFGQAGDAEVVNREVKKLNNDIQSEKSKINKIQEKQQEYSRAIREKQSERASLSNQLAILDNRIAKAELDIEIVEADVESTRLEMKKTDIQIEDKNKEIDNVKGHIANILKLMHQRDNISSLEIVLMNESLSDFLSQAQYLENVNESIDESLKELERLRRQLEKEKEGLARQGTELEKLKKELEDKRAALDSEKENKISILTQVSQSESQYQHLLAQAKKEQEQAAAEIASLEKMVRSKLANLEGNKLDFNDGGLIWPVTKNVVTAYFRDPSYPFRHIFEHPAIDVRAAQGSTLKAAASGYVARVVRGLDGGYGYIMIIHGDGLSTVYGHISNAYVKEDDYVIQGQTIGLTGGMPGTPGAGRLTTGPHLHFEVRLNGIPVDPLSYLP